MYFPYVEGMGDLRNDFDQLETKLDAMRKAEVLFIDDLFKPVKGAAGDGLASGTNSIGCELSVLES